MIDTVAFGVVLLLLVLWLASWAAIGAVVAVSQGQEVTSGLIHGLTFGPVGVLFVALNGRHQAVRKSTAPVTQTGRERPTGQHHNRDRYS